MHINPSSLINRIMVLGTVLLICFPHLGYAGSQEVLRIPMSTDIGTFDPDNGFEIEGIGVINNVYEGLVDYEEQSTTLRGRLADSWTISADGRVYTFKVRSGVKFHDGSVFSAADVVKSLERRREGKFSLSYFLDNVADVNAPDDSTVLLTLKQAQPSFLDSLASPWGPKVIGSSALTQHDKGDRASEWLNEHAVGTGPFKLSDLKRGERYGLTRNDDYWGRKPFFNEIRLPVIPDIGQQILQLRSGQIDAVPRNYPFEQLGSLPPGLEITAAPNMTQYDLFLKPGTPLDNPEVRQAFLTAVNPALWVGDAFGKFGTIAQSIFPKIVLSPTKPIVFPSDFNAAKDIVKKHGDITLMIGMFSGTSSYRRISDLLISQLSTIGINATSSVLAPGAGFAVKNDPKAPDILLVIAGPDAAHPENQVGAFYTETAPLNFFGRIVPDADGVVKQARKIAKPGQSWLLYEEAGDRYFNAGVSIPLVDVDDVVVHLKGLKNLGLRPVYPIGSIDFATVERSE